MLNFTKAMSSVVCDSFKHIFQGCITGTKTILRNPEGRQYCFGLSALTFLSKTTLNPINFNNTRWDIGKSFGDK